MKKGWIACLGVCMLMACEKDLYKGENIVNDNKFMMQEPYSVPLQNGSIAVVTLGDDTLAVTDIPLTIDVPLGSSPLTRADDNSRVRVSYTEYADMPEFVAGSFIEGSNHVMMFEDSKTADYDYNDLILHVKMLLSGSLNGKQTYQFKVRGLALGSGQRIGFGFTDGNEIDYDLSDDVRRDYFNGQTGFINTAAGRPFVSGIVSSENMENVYVNATPFPYTIVHKRQEKRETAQDLLMTTGYFLYDKILTTNVGNTKVMRFYIRAGSEKFYVGEYDKNMEGALPYGIRFPEGQSLYPLEKIPMGEAFPQFLPWVKTGSPTDWNSKAKTNTANCYQLDTSGLWRW